ncbi:MAG TPA: tetratricopeptide repeat protein [Candidatus Aminicenantes bacterium]|nr:tetratricopeptide repeat protein [Candidatus Aminicenantes bacterium]
MGEKRVLDGWKAISTYLGRTAKTCRKWEHELGLPVRRLDDSASAHVFAYADEIDRWKDEKQQAAKSQIIRGPFGFPRKKRFWLIGASAAVLMVIAGATAIHWKIIPLVKPHAAPKIENSIAVISFRNQTGDPAYDYLQEAIPNLLITNLENTKLFYVATWERMRDVLKQMGVWPARTIESDLGFEICRREGIQAIAIGSFTKAGDIFRTDVKVLDAKTKRLLISANRKGTGVGSILDTQIDELSREMFFGLGAEEAKVETARLNIRDISTRSLRAYEHFLKGKEAYALESWADLKMEMEKALEIDPSFAMAYVFLAYANYFLGDIKARNETIKKAMAFSDRTSEKDRLYLDGAYATFVLEDRDRCVTVLKELVRKYPKEKSARHNLGDTLYVKRDYAGAREQYGIWLDLDPKDTFAIDHLLMALIPLRDFGNARKYLKMRNSIGPPNVTSLQMEALMYRKMGDVGKAIAKNKEALKIEPNFFWSASELSRLYALKEEYGEAMRWADEYVSLAPSSGQRAMACLLRGFYKYWRGVFREALDDFAQAERMAEAVENWPGKAAAVKWEGIVHLELDEYEACRSCFEETVGICTEHFPGDAAGYRAQAARWMGHLAIKQGKADEVNARLFELESFLPEIDGRTFKDPFFWHDLLRGEALLAQGCLDAAFLVGRELCRPGAPFQTDSMSSMDLLARIYAERGEVGGAISEYERLLNRGISADVAISEFERPLILPGATDLALFIHPLYHYRLGLLLEKAGNAARARGQYRRFLDLWKDADPGRPEVEDAGKRLNELERR